MLNLANLLFKKKKAAEKEDEIVKAEVVKVDYGKEIEEKISVHIMPERFRTLHVKKNKAKSMGIIVIAGGILLFGIIGFVFYYFLFKSVPSAPPIDTATTTESGLETGFKKEEIPKAEEEEPKKEEEKSAEESYREIKAEFDRVENFSQLEEVSKKYGSQNKLKELEKYKEEIANLPEEFKNNVAVLLVQQSMPKLNEIGEIKEEIIADKAVLNITSKDLKKKGTILLVKEDGLWKLESESWSEGATENNNSNSGSTGTVFTEGVDSDQDGLTDKEESVLGTDSSLGDSDGDGYTDFSELSNSYNPNGTGKIEENLNIASYSNATNKYSLIHPKDWTVMISGGENSIIFKSPDNHFIQVITQLNTNKETIEKWYSTQFGAAVINDANKITAATWQGIKSEDGLTVYLTDLENNNIYTITYNIGIDNILEYKNIFDMLVKSFSISK